MELALACGFCFGSVALAVAGAWQPLSRRFAGFVDRRTAEAGEQLGDMFLDVPIQKLWQLYAASPLLVGGLAWLLTGNPVAGGAGLAVGILVPRAIIRMMQAKRQKQFHGQLVDSLLLMSSSLKAGLSMLQAFGVVAEEMPPPISQEFGLLLKETRMGVSLEEAILHLKRRVPSDDLNLFATAVLVARETGGDITHIFGRLVQTMRERKQLKEKIISLTYMSRMQGIIMALLPFGFALFVYNMNKDYFVFFVKEELGRMLLVVIGFLQVVGLLLFKRFSRTPT
jgi:tight adherence protein B